jgi:hypothetical protein
LVRILPIGFYDVLKKDKGLLVNIIAFDRAAVDRLSFLQISRLHDDAH